MLMEMKDVIVAQERFVALSKYRDGYRIAIASQFGTRDAIIARSAEDALMVAEAYIRQGESHYGDALTYINMLRDRAGYASGEDRAVNVDGGQAYKNNAYCKDKGGGYSADGAISQVRIHIMNLIILVPQQNQQKKCNAFK